MRGAELVDPDGRAREAVQEVAHTARMVDVHVRHDDVGQVPAPDTERTEGIGHGLDVGAGARFDEARLRRREQVHRVQLALARHAGVDPRDAGRRVARQRLEVGHAAESGTR